MLTEQQIKHFNTFGFVILKSAFGADELVQIEQEFDGAMEAVYRHASFDGTSRHWVTMMGSDTPRFSILLEDDRFCVPAEQLYGSDVVGLCCDANRYVGNTKWHPDTRSTHQYGVKFAFYLDPVGPDTGALRVVPGSHKPPLHDDLQSARDESRLLIEEVPSHVCASEPGDVVAFDLRLWHSSWGGSDDRRMCTIVYYNNPKTPEEEAVTREQGQANANTGEKFGRPNEPIHPPDWIANTNGNQKRKRWIERLRELDYPGFV